MSLKKFYQLLNDAAIHLQAKYVLEEIAPPSFSATESNVLHGISMSKL
jgi:hypothetical protein